jgi:hypothetical protein
MELNFKKSDNVYVAEFQADGDFALHVEKGKGSLVVYQRSVERGEYDVVRGLDVNVNDTCVDVDIVGAVFPKWIKVESNIMPTRAEVVFA